MSSTFRYTAVAAAIAGVATLTACSGSGSGTVTLSGSANPAAGSTTTPAPVRTTTAPAEPVSSTTHSQPKVKGCGSGDDLAIPKGAATAKSADLDGDGKADTIWISKPDGQGQAGIGIRTASGHGYATRVSLVSDSANKVSLVAGKVGGVPVLLLDNGTVSLFSGAGCAINPTLNKQGDQYTFKTDGTAPSYDSGVGCPSGILAGYHAKWYDDGAEYKVTRTTVNLSEDGRTATNGSTVTVKQVASDGDPVLVKAQSVWCQGSTAKL